MAELTAKQGKDIILLYRLLSKATKEAAWKLAFQTEHSNEKTRDYNTTATKDGTIGSLAAIEYSLSATSIAANGDPHLDEMDKAFDDGEIIEVWEIDKAEKGSDGKYKAKYLRAYLTSFSYEPNSEDALELSLEFGVFGKPQKGQATLTEEQANVVQYVFKDTVAG
ncbi:MAG: phage major tail protein, TP901-1 family [Tetragenococcus halophilus]|jgi:TP901-1 family phage major tail protein|uniref:major tail protein n=3 Tax=root TaxID=1 RepID=UPI000009B5A5|nr:MULTISPECIES: phage major tail protein, TP901-1 family [Lactococcus]NP_108722.1 major tail protein [Lactococcus phage Tuc2009]NP_663681.1 major tail protein [Lactococcus phage ul36]ABD63683.1 putative major tail protein [Lactococcus phage ul36.k1]MDN6127413.1 phage major tail protein, TP901-1 family [Tetragenococcus halophilus]MDN6625602.1 phage major tail protein, TP901-1 family [Pisciglobus halotolerans]MRM59092.1 phage major tail protein, TP901-1 family [Lactococcus cremoris]UXD81381.1